MKMASLVVSVLSRTASDTSRLSLGLKGKNLPCHCPYCGHSAAHDHFWTKEQIEYAKSLATRKITESIHIDLKKMEFDHKPKGAFGIGLSLKVKPGRGPALVRAAHFLTHLL